MPISSTHRRMLWIVAIGFFMETLDSTIVNTALPAMAKSLHADPLSMHAVVIAYSLTLAVLIPVSGWVADRFSIRRTFMAAILIFSIGSALCSVAPTLPILIIARVFQGIGGSMLMPVGRLAILRVFPQSQFLAAMSFVAVPALVGPLVGPTLGGFLVEFATWHWIFLINIPVGLVGLYATRRYMQAIPVLPVKPFDYKGFFMLSLMMISFSVALEGVSDDGYQHATVMMLVVLGFAGLVTYILHASREPRALFHLEIFRTRSFSVGILGNLFARIGSASMPFLVPLLLQVNLDYSPLQAGSTMIPIALAAIICRSFAPPFIMRIGYRRFLVMNTMILGLTIISLAFLGAHQPAWIRVLQLIVFGTVNSLQFSAMNSLTLKDLEAKDTSSGNSLLSMTQMLALSLGAANAGALLTTFNHYFHGVPHSSTPAFQATFVCLGAITCLSTWVFAQLERNSHNPPPPTQVTMS